MAYTVAIGAIVEVRFVANLFGQLMMNVRHYRFKDGPDTDGRNLAEAIVDKLNNTGELDPLMAACQTENVTSRSIEAQWIYPTRYRLIFDDGNPVDGVAADPCVPQNISATISLYAEQANKHGQGRMRVYGCPAAMWAAGEWDAAQITLLDALGAKMIEELEVGDQTLEPIIYNRVTPTNSLRITAFRTQNTARTQRSRTIGHGV